jgi:hypothetical protein
LRFRTPWKGGILWSPEAKIFCLDHSTKGNLSKFREMIKLIMLRRGRGSRRKRRKEQQRRKRKRRKEQQRRKRRKEQQRKRKS